MRTALPHTPAAVFASLLLLILLPPPTTAQAADAAAADIVIDEQKLRYAVTYGGHRIGELEADIRKQDHGYVVTCTGKLNRLIKLLLKKSAVRSVTRFVRRRNAIVLDGGSEQVIGKHDEAPDSRRSFYVNHAHNRIELSNGKHIALHPGEQLDAAAFPLLLMLRPPAELAATQAQTQVQARVREVSAKRVRDYRYENPVAETVRVPAGEFPAWKISRHRIDRPEERVSVWLHRASNPIPLKIVLTKKGNVRTLQLLEQSTEQP